jgi:hypothetical protein
MHFVLFYFVFLGGDNDLMILDGYHEKKNLKLKFCQGGMYGKAWGMGHFLILT